MEAHSLRAPSQDGGLLAVPPLNDAPGLLDRNSQKLAVWSYDVQGREAASLRGQARDEVFARARAYHEQFGLAVPPSRSAKAPLIVTGHQPELYHPGVWVKNFAAASIAHGVGGSALNLIVDNDLPKGVGLRVPTGTDGDLGVRRVDFDSGRSDIPYEDDRVADESVFRSFAERVREVLTPSIADPLIDEFWPKAVAAGQSTDRIGTRFAIARHGIEADWGVVNLEVPLSSVCETEPFLWFACHLLAHLERFQTVHNEALERYRHLYGIRSRHHPVPALGRQGEWLEAPFWVWRADSPRRHALLAKPSGRTLTLRIAGESDTLVELPLAADREACCAVERFRELSAKGVRLRTRALTTTMFARFFLSDLFLHGIGGAKYDELGDAVAARFFGVEPPGYLTLSMTLMLGVPRDADAADRLCSVERRLRRLTYSPDLFLPRAVESDASTLVVVDEKRALLASEPTTPAEKKARWQKIRACNSALHPLIEPLRERCFEERNALEAAAHRDTIARSREYSLVVHSAARLRKSFLAATTIGPEN